MGAIVVAVFLGMTYKYIVDYVRKKLIKKKIRDKMASRGVMSFFVVFWSIFAKNGDNNCSIIDIKSKAD